MQKRQSLHLQELRQLVEQPEEQARMAETLLRPRLGTEVILGALRVLSNLALPTARPALRSLYAYYEEKGMERDPAANLRAAILRAVRPLVQPEDLPWLTQAATTFVFPPPAFKEEGALVRSAALNALNEVDETLARYHAVRLLANEHTDPMSGEPALTAARLLASHEETASLYFYVMQDGARVLPEVISECLRGLTRLPDSLIAGLLDRYADSPHDLVLVGLFDLLLNHQTGPHGREWLQHFLRTTQRLAAYRYLVAVLIAAGRQELLDDLLAAAQVERQPTKLAILADALAVVERNLAVNELLSTLRSRLAPR